MSTAHVGRLQALARSSFYDQENPFNHDAVGSNKFYIGNIFARTAQKMDTHYEIGIVYYTDNAVFKALAKEAAPQSGRSKYSARVKGPHA